MKVAVIDPFGVTADPELPTLAMALDPLEVTKKFKRGFPRLTTTGFVTPKTIRVTRYRPGRRCVIEYDARVEEVDGRRRKLMLIGKVRARRSGNEGYRLLEAIWNAGFDKHSVDRVSVPEPIGVIPGFRMWFQRKVRGKTATELLAGRDGVQLSRRIVEAISKLHRANVPTKRHHTMADELRILQECLAQVIEQRRTLARRLQRMLEASKRLAESVPEPNACGVHRDFYPDQVIVDGARLYLIDFDLYCQGDPALDVGNFIGHMTEQSLRELGDPGALAKQERALEDRFAELSGERTRASVRAYATLTLVRHIYLSTQFSERLPFTERLLELCEQRLGLT